MTPDDPSVVAAAQPSPAARRIRLDWLVLVGLYGVGAVLGVPSGFGALWFVPYAGVGTLLVIRRPGLSIGWILIGLGWAFVAVSGSVEATVAEFEAGTEGVLNATLAVLGASMGSVGFLLIAILAIVFPSGRLPQGRWAAPTRAAIAIAAGSIVLGMLGPTIAINLWASNVSTAVRNPIAILGWLPIWGVAPPDVGILPAAGLMVAAAASVAVRYRRAVGVERQQLRWLAAAVAFVVLAVVGGFVIGQLSPALAATGLIWLGAVVAFPCVPIAIGIAVLRYRLYDIDRVVSRTISWGLVSVLTAAAFVLPVLALQGFFVGLTQGDTLAVAISTLIAASLFQPLRHRIQAAVDRRFDRARVDGQQTAGVFAERLRNRVDLDGLQADLATTVSDALRPRSTGLWVREVAGRGPRS